MRELAVTGCYLENVIPMMERKGLGKAEIRMLCVENPARMLTLV